MQRAHGGNKTDAFAGTMRFFAYGCNFGGGGENEHFGAISSQHSAVSTQHSVISHKQLSTCARAP
jgi:hypothetical protein